MAGLAESRWASAKPSPRWQHAPQYRPQYQVQQPPPQPQPIAPSPIPLAVNSTPIASGSRVAAGAIQKTEAPASPEQEIARFNKIVARLKWKVQQLALGYRLATERVGRPVHEVTSNEIQFKIDWFEYYMLIERALVHLMGVFGIRVSGLASSVHNPIFKGEASHRFHANVLGALDNRDNPLHDVLGGASEARRQLQRAKDLRNRWKNGDEDNKNRGYARAPLEAYSIDKIIDAIFSGFDQGYELAKEYLDSSSDLSDHSMNWEEEDWHFMTDAMDWEAV